MNGNIQDLFRNCPHLSARPHIYPVPQFQNFQRPRHASGKQNVPHLRGLHRWTTTSERFALLLCLSTIQTRNTRSCPITAVSPHNSQTMEYLTLPGESCYTQAETEKLKDAVHRRGAPVVSNIQGCWIYYVHLGHCDSVKVNLKSCL
jgi:hypothetical protein